MDDSTPGIDDPKGGVTATAEWVADAIRDRIVKGEIDPGSRLIERTISAELSVSRTPVREALKLLRMDGLIEISRNRGAQVLPFTATEAQNLFELIAAMESIAARRLATRLSASLLDKLESLHESMIGHHRDGRHSEYFDINSEIHDLIVTSCGNPVIMDAHRRLMARARRGRYLAIMRPERLEQAVTEHEALMQALRRADPDDCARIWEQHLRHTGDTLVSVLSNGTP